MGVRRDLRDLVIVAVCVVLITVVTSIYWMFVGHFILGVS